MDLKKIKEYLQKDIDDMDFVDAKIARNAESIYIKYNRDFSYYFIPKSASFIYRPVLGVFKIIGTIIMFFQPATSNFELWGFSGSIFYRKERFFSDKLEKAVKNLPEINDNELPLFVYYKSPDDTFIITDKNIYLNLSKSSKMKDQLKKDSKKGRIDISKIRKGEVKYKKLTNSAEIYINDEHIGGFVMRASKDGIVLNNILNSITH